MNAHVRKIIFTLFLLSFWGGKDLIAQPAAVLAGMDTTNRVITTAVPFLMITPDARAAGMGDVGVATSADANSVHWNNAKLAFNEEDYGVSLNYTPWLGRIVNDMSVQYLSAFYKITREQAVAFSIKHFNLGDIQLTDEFGEPLNLFNPRETALDATYSRMLSENLGIGVTGRFIHSNLAGSFSSTMDARAGTSIAADVGVYYNKDLIFSGNNSSIAFGAFISNIGQKLTYSSLNDQDFIPTNLRVGAAFTTDLDPYNSITFALDFNKLMVPSTPVYAFNDDGTLQRDANNNPIIDRGLNPDRPILSGMFLSFVDAPDGFREEMQEIMISAGLEYWYRDLFSLRTGYFYESPNKGDRRYVTAGVGLKYQMLGIDFAYLVPFVQNHPLAETLRLSLTLLFDKKDKSAQPPVNPN